MSQPAAPDRPEVVRDGGTGFSGALRTLGSKRELIVVLALCLAVSFVLTNLKTLRIDQFNGDSAMFFQVTDNIAKRGVPLSGIYVNVKQFADSKLVLEPAARVATDPLAPAAVPEGNILRLHSYFVLYPLALIAKFVPVETTLEASFVLSFVGLIAAAYLVLRRRGIPVAAACLFGVLIVAHAAWAGSVLSGQFFPDRLFVLAGFLLMIAVSRTSPSRAALIAATLFCAIVHERGALTAGLAILLYVGLTWRTVADRALKLWLGAGALVCGIVLLKFFVYASPYGSFLPGSLQQVMLSFQDPAFVAKAKLFVEMSVPLLILACFAWRAALVAVVMMLPNFFGSIGGAEKTGWSTHYHSYYLPFLVWAAMEGYANAYRLAIRRKLAVALYAAAVVLILVANSIDPITASANISPGNVGNNVFTRLYREATTYPGPTAPDFPVLAAELRRAVPPGSTVSSLEATMAELYRDRTVYFMPLGVDRADYAIMGVTVTPNKPPVYSGIPSFLGPLEQVKVNSAVVERMRRAGYDVAHPTLILGLGVAVFHRPH